MGKSIRSKREKRLRAEKRQLYSPVFLGKIEQLNAKLVEIANGPKVSDDIMGEAPTTDLAPMVEQKPKTPKVTVVIEEEKMEVDSTELKQRVGKPRSNIQKKKKTTPKKVHKKRKV